MLRDAWYACWLKSADELLDSPVRVVGQNGATALELLRKAKRIETAPVSGGVRLVGIGERRDGVAGRHWQLFVSNAPVNELPDHYQPANGQTIEWRFVR
jgi:hypothetical protein